MKSSVSVSVYLGSLIFGRIAVDGIAAFQVFVRQERCAARIIHQSTATIPFPATAQHHRSALYMNMFGGLFGGNSNAASNRKLALDEPVTVYTSLGGGGGGADNANTNNDIEFEGLSDYITQWANNRFANGGIKLTTPVVVEPVASENTRGIRLLFKNTDTGYKNKNEESESGNAHRRPPPEASNDDDAPKKKKGKLQGGVEILVQKNTTTTGISEVKVLARRCEIDDDTVIKEMSEETIMSELHQAIAVWKREK